MSVCEENPYIVCGEGGYKCSHMLDGPPLLGVDIIVGKNREKYPPPEVSRPSCPKHTKILNLAGLQHLKLETD